MARELSLVDVTGTNGDAAGAQWLARAESVHRQLRDRLPVDYVGRMNKVFANGARMSLAVEGPRVCGVSVWRIVENTYEGRRFYVDDLVVDPSLRSQGIGRFLVSGLEAKARALDCDVLALDSGTQRTDAHRFYFREGMVIPSFCFRKSVT